MRVAIAAVLVVLAACVPEEEELIKRMPYEAECAADKLQHLVGQPVEAYDFAAEGKPLRILPPGSMMTMDHRPDRLNVDLDEEGVITRIWCG